MTTGTRITAILTTWNRADLLPKVLDGFRRQSLPREQFEIVAIDDGSSDETAAILQQATSDLPLRSLRQNHAGLAAAKNLGVFASRSAIVVFVDDDDVIDPACLRAHVEAHERHPERETAILGHTRLGANVYKHPVMRHITEVGCQLFSYAGLKPGRVGGYTEFWGGRTSCKRDLLLEHGLFDPDFTFGCEDIELGYRLSRFGLRVIYEPRAGATMIRSIGVREFCRRSQRQGRSQWRFAALHPAPEVRTYCEIDRGLDLWKAYLGRFAQFSGWVERLDRLANVREEAGRPLDPPWQAELDEAYREVFSLWRAKGIAEASIAEAA